MNISFEGKVALVTGAASGLGLAAAKAFAKSGASVALADWNASAVVAAVEKLTTQGHKAIAIRCDVADDAQVEAMVTQTVKTFGRLDAAYNNAGVQNVLAETADTTREDYDRVMGINLRGEWSCMKFELQHMRKQGSGAIVNCSSLGGTREGAPSVASTTRPSTESWVSPKARLSSTRRVASVSTQYALALSGRRWPTRWLRPVRAMLSRQWRRVCPWDGSAAPRRLQMPFCGCAAMPPAT